MSSILSTTAWKQLNSRLHVAIDRDLEIALLPILRVIWPGLVRPRGMGPHDSAGCDLVEQSEDARLRAVIQCKGFYASEGLGTSQVRQILASIEAFKASPLVCDEYVLIHNRDGRNREATATIDAALLGLVETGKARLVRQWDRWQCLKAIENQLRQLISERLKLQTETLLTEMDSLFDVGGQYVTRLPVRSGRLLIKPNARPQVRNAAGLNVRIIDLVGELARAKPHKWTMLIGLFGAGKTSAALHAAKERPNEVVYVPAASLEPRRGELGTNVLMSKITEALHLFDDYEDDEKTVFQRLSGPVLRGMLSAEETEMTLIIDALDENRALAAPDEITRFASMLAELRCKVILTTREEHFRATFGNYEHMFKGLAWKGGGIRDIDLFELQNWGKAQIAELLENAVEQHPDNGHLARLLDAVLADETCGWPNELLAHPFFLQMIIDLVAEGANPIVHRAELLERWSWAKLIRDLQSARKTCVPVTDRDAYIDDMQELMTRISAEMVEHVGDEVRLLETINSDRVLEIASDLFGVRCTDLGSVVSVALLNPVAIKYRGSIPVRFTHRAFQEFYLARSISRVEPSGSAYPESVRKMAEELR